MPSPVYQAASMADILLAVQARVLEVVFGGPKHGYVVLDRRGLPKGLNADRYVTVRPGNLRPDTYAGAGRRGTPVVRDVLVGCYVRNDSDPVGSAKVALTDPEVGLVRLEESVGNALGEWFPADEEGRRLTVEPLLLADSPDEEGGDAPTGRFATVTLAFRCKYLFPYTSASAPA